MSNPTTEIKERMRVALQVRGMTQQELANKSGIPKSSISQYLSGHVKPKGDRVYLMAKALKVDEAWLLGYDVPMDKANKTKHDDVAIYVGENEAIVEELLEVLQELPQEQMKELVNYAQFLKQKGKP